MSIISVKVDIFNTLTLFGVGPLWFLPALFIAECIFMFAKIKTNKTIYAILFQGCISVCFILPLIFCSGNYNTALGRFTLAMVRMIVALFFINIGYYLYNIIKNVNLKMYQLIILSIVSVVFSIINGRVDLWGLQFNNIFLYVFNSIIGSLAIIFMMKKINRSKVLDFLGKNTLIIMATHQLIIKFILASSLGIKLNKFIILCLVLAIEYPIIKIINRYLPFMLGKKRIKIIKNEKLNTSIG